MIQATKVYKVLSNFDIYELNRLKKFIASPYFNKNEAVQRYFESLFPLLKSENEETQDKTELWKSIFPDDPYNDQKFRKLSSDLLKLIESFLANEEFGDNPLHKANYLLEAISNKDLEVLYNSGISSANRLSSQQIERASTYYYHQYQKERNIYSLGSEFEKKMKSKDKAIEVNLGEISINLDKFFIAEKLKYACTLLSLKNMMRLEDDILFIDEIIEYVKKNDFNDTPPILMYYQIYLSTVEPENLDHYYRLKDLLARYITLFPPKEARSIFDSALNYCIRKINQGKLEFQNELMELYIQGIESKTLLVKEELSPTSFRNICFIALRVGKYDWAERFVEDYASYLNPKFRANAVTFNLARINYYKKDFDRVIEYLREVEFDDLIYNLTSKSILLATYYETDEFEALHAMFESFRIYLSRNKSNMPERYYSSYTNLIKYTKKLSRLNTRDKEKIEKTKKEIEETESVADKKWLLQKLRELSGS